MKKKSTTESTVEAFASLRMVTSRLDIMMRIVGTLATTSKYTVMVTSVWGSTTFKMEKKRFILDSLIEAQPIIKMIL